MIVGLCRFSYLARDRAGRRYPGNRVAGNRVDGRLLVAGQDGNDAGQDRDDPDDRHQHYYSPHDCRHLIPL